MATHTQLNGSTRRQHLLAKGVAEDEGGGAFLLS